MVLKCEKILKNCLPTVCRAVELAAFGGLVDTKISDPISGLLSLSLHFNKIHQAICIYACYSLRSTALEFCCCLCGCSWSLPMSSDIWRLRENRGHREDASVFLRPRFGNGRYHFCLYSSGGILVTWSHLTERDSENR